jgi:hypothetical protein
MNSWLAVSASKQGLASVHGRFQGQVRTITQTGGRHSNRPSHHFKSISGSWASGHGDRLDRAPQLKILVNCLKIR